jgi:hypothetical protein
MVFVKVAGFRKGMSELVASLIALRIKFLCTFVHQNHSVVFVYQKGGERDYVQRLPLKG